jgi:lipoyl(octanoyl) transferase
MKKEELHTLCSVRIRDCGLIPYRPALDLQLELVDQRRAEDIGDTVLILEHEPVITLGARQTANHLLATRDELAAKGIDLIDIRRGGGATAHNLGQLVFYPILHLQQARLGINEYIRKLEQIGIDLLRRLGVDSDRKKGFPGLWVDTRKIASIGVRVSKFVTYHGMAININNDLSIFTHFIPCGLDGVQMTSVLEETAVRHDMNGVKRYLSDLLRKHLSFSKETPK